MLYKFKSQATADVIMLRPNGQQMLKIIGKEDHPQGIITVDQIPAAIAALEAAVIAHEAAQQRAAAHQAAGGEEEELEGDGVMLRQRAAPFIDLLRRSAEAGKDVVWGV
jgi:Domain of unknown function (DUF1840)